jgi:hypothetical protein
LGKAKFLELEKESLFHEVQSNVVRLWPFTQELSSPLLNQFCEILLEEMFFGKQTYFTIFMFRSALARFSTHLSSNVLTEHSSTGRVMGFQVKSTSHVIAETGSDPCYLRVILVGFFPKEILSTHLT